MLILSITQVILRMKFDFSEFFGSHMIGIPAESFSAFNLKGNF